MQNNDLIGKMVLSKAGRDKNHMYIVIGSLNDQYVFLSNGNTKCIDNPKKKKLKHLDFYDDIDLKIKRFLKLKGIVKEGWLPYVKRWCYRDARYSTRSIT